ncbi:hypothetical protein, partial [Streptobacillus moniliformis]|uniref:hypothetical protein n=1 Tax=Streptobacillus moniliformis TaxID=34105 RepID=UPI000B0F4287
MLNDYVDVASNEDKRGLYGFGLNGVANTILGLRTDTPLSDVMYAKKETYSKSCGFCIGVKSYINGIEQAFVEAKDDKDV